MGLRTEKTDIENLTAIAQSHLRTVAACCDNGGET
jgi:hypothetical protein